MGSFWAYNPQPYLASADIARLGSQTPEIGYASGAGGYVPADVEVTPPANAALSSYFDAGVTLQKAQAKLAAKQGELGGPGT
ncbi:MAG: hypothetical protein ABSF66_03475 [Terriglobales bacterium]|jgi:hypothetical protein